MYGNLPIQVVRTELILSSNNTVNYMYDDKDKDTFRLVAWKTFSKTGKRSTYINNNSNHMCSMRVKLTYTFSAVGTMVLIFVFLLNLRIVWKRWWLWVGG